MRKTKEQVQLGLGIGMIAVAAKYAVDVSMPKPIVSEAQHTEYLLVLGKLTSVNKPTKAQEAYAQVLITLIEAYEDEHHAVPDASPIEVLRTLMEANDLRQKDLVPVFGSDGIVSEVLHRKREINKTHIVRLSKLFQVSPAVFF